MLRGRFERRERQMPATNRTSEQTIRDRAYFIWEREGRPEGRAHDHWYRAMAETRRPERRLNVEPMMEEEKLLAGRVDVDMPALLTKDVPGG
jgi:hypothetical protein